MKRGTKVNWNGFTKRKVFLHGSPFSLIRSSIDEWHNPRYCYLRLFISPRFRRWPLPALFSCRWFMPARVRHARRDAFLFPFRDATQNLAPLSIIRSKVIRYSRNVASQTRSIIVDRRPKYSSTPPSSSNEPEIVFRGSSAFFSSSLDRFPLQNNPPYGSPPAENSSSLSLT